MRLSTFTFTLAHEGQVYECKISALASAGDSPLSWTAGIGEGLQEIDISEEDAATLRCLGVLSEFCKPI